MSDQKITDYTVVTAAALSDLVESICEHIAEGWQPHGGVAIAPSGEEDFALRYAQALVKYEQPTFGQPHRAT